MLMCTYMLLERKPVNAYFKLQENQIS